MEIDREPEKFRPICIKIESESEAKFIHTVFSNIAAEEGLNYKSLNYKAMAVYIRNILGEMIF